MRRPPPPHRPIRWRARPALVLAGCLAAGVWSARALPSLSFVHWVAVVGTAAVVVGASGWWRGQRLVSLAPTGLTLGLGLLVVALGGVRMALWQDLPPDDVSHLAAIAEGPVVLEGRVADHPAVTARGVRFVLDLEAARGMRARHPVSGPVQVALWQPRDGAAPRIPYPDLEAGDRVRLSGTLRPITRRRNPADFDYGAWLTRRGIRATFAASDSGAAVVLGHEAGPLDRLANVTRRRVRITLRRYRPDPDARAVLAALLLADRSRIDDATREAFATTGLMHLLAISGLHVLLVGLGLYGLLKPMLHRLGWSWRRVEIVRAVVTLALLGLYVLATGAPASAVRALVMAAVLIVGTATERAPNTLNALGVAALVLLLVRPTFLFDVGFQLSFAAVGGIVLLMPVLERTVPIRWTTGAAGRWAVNSTLVSLAATLGTMPVLLWHFGRLPLAGLVLNLAAIPATALTLGSGLLTVAFTPLAGLASATGAAAQLGATTLLWISRTGAEWLDWSNVGVTVHSLWVVTALVAGLVALALGPRPRHRWRMIGVTLALAAVAVWQPVFRGEHAPTLEVLFFDVGQGDAALLRLPSGRHVLVDAGVRDPYTDQGERTILPHLAWAGIDRLDAVVVSHPHADHLGGLPAVLRAIPVAHVIHNGHRYGSRLFAETDSLLNAHHVHSRAVTAGDTLLLDPAVHIQVLAPTHAPGPDDEANEGSVVLRVTYGDTAFLLTGDAEDAAEDDLVARYGEALRSDVVKVAHHGSRTSSIPDFVERTQAEMAVVSVARRNRYGLPDAPVLDRWREAGADVLQTWETGAVWLRSDGRTVNRVDWR